MGNCCGTSSAAAVTTVADLDPKAAGTGAELELAKLQKKDATGNGNFYNVNKVLTDSDCSSHQENPLDELITLNLGSGSMHENVMQVIHRRKKFKENNSCRHLKQFNIKRVINDPQKAPKQLSFGFAEVKREIVDLNGAFTYAHFDPIRTMAFSGISVMVLQKQHLPRDWDDWLQRSLRANILLWQQQEEEDEDDKNQQQQQQQQQQRTNCWSAVLRPNIFVIGFEKPCLVAQYDADSVNSFLHAQQAEIHQTVQPDFVGYDIVRAPCLPICLPASRTLRRFLSVVASLTGCAFNLPSRQSACFEQLGDWKIYEHGSARQRKNDDTHHDSNDRETRIWMALPLQLSGTVGTTAAVGQQGPEQTTFSLPRFAQNRQQPNKIKVAGLIPCVNSLTEEVALPKQPQRRNETKPSEPQPIWTPDITELLKDATRKKKGATPSISQLLKNSPRKKKKKHNCVDKQEESNIPAPSVWEETEFSLASHPPAPCRNAKRAKETQRHPPTICWDAPPTVQSNATSPVHRSGPPPGPLPPPPVTATIQRGRSPEDGTPLKFRRSTRRSSAFRPGQNWSAAEDETTHQ